MEAVLKAAFERRRRLQSHGLAKVSIEGTTASAVSAEGQTAQMPLAEVLAKLGAQCMDLSGIILPDGIKTVVHQPPVLIWVWECAPRLHNLNWIAGDSPVPFGHGSRYRAVRLALPYVVLLAVFSTADTGQWHLTNTNECFFRTAPLKSLADELLYPALLNCSKFDPPEGRPLSWICTQYLKPNALMQSPDLNLRLRSSLDALRRVLFETGFNWSSDHHEAASWFSESRQVDPRVNSVEAWEQSSARDPLFVLEVPWLKTGHSLGEVCRRIGRNLRAANAHGVSAATLARIIFNQKPASPPEMAGLFS